MKTLKSTIIPGLLILVTSLPLVFTSCTKETVDLRDEIIGQYDYTVEIYREVGGKLVYAGDEGTVGDIIGTMRVTKSTLYTDGLDFYDGNIVMFEAINLKDVGNAIVFDIPQQEAWVGPGNVQVTGYNYWDVDASSYHGAFLYDDQSVEIAFAARIMDIESGLVMVLTAKRI